MLTGLPWGSSLEVGGGFQDARVGQGLESEPGSGRDCYCLRVIRKKGIW